MSLAPCPQCKGTRYKADSLGCHGRRPQHRGGVGDDGTRGRRLFCQPRPARARRLGGAAHHARGGGAAGFLRKCRLGLPHARPEREHAARAARRSASAWRRRWVRGSQACSTFWTSHPSAFTRATTDRLLGTLLSLRDLGNTLIVVEHDEETMRAGGLYRGFGSRRGRPRRARHRRRSARRAYGG